jgi:hypothetical protein
MILGGLPVGSTGRGAGVPIMIESEPEQLDD